MKLGAETADEQLMLAFKSGDAKAFAELVRRHRGPVYNFILRFTGHRQRSEDLLQETWLKVVRSAPEYETKARFTTWLYTIARNLCVDSARKESYRRTDSLDAPAGNEEDGRPLGETLADGQGSFDPERGAENARMQPLIQQAILQLPEEQREVFVLREYGGVPFKEIAAVTGVSENTVKSRMRYALEALRRRLMELGIGEELATDRSAAG